MNVIASDMMLQLKIREQSSKSHESYLKNFENFIAYSQETKFVKSNIKIAFKVDEVFPLKKKVNFSTLEIASFVGGILGWKHRKPFTMF